MCGGGGGGGGWGEGVWYSVQNGVIRISTCYLFITMATLNILNIETPELIFFFNLTTPC